MKLPTALTREVGVTRSLVEVVQQENLALRAHRNDAEDHFCCGVFYGIAENLSESWTQMREVILNIFRQLLNLEVADGVSSK